MASAAPVPVARNRRVAMAAALFAAAMLALGFAAVPLYRMFCQATGYGGTTQRASQAEAAGVNIAAGSISVRFDGNLDRGMPWKFAPLQITQEMRIGTQRMAYFRAENLSDKTITGAASYNVEPEEVARYFKKIQCFCFNKQKLAPHEVVEMPVLYYVDPALLDDKDVKAVQQITLSYTFHVVPPA